MRNRSKHRALVLGDDIGVYLAVARSLGRYGVEVHVVPSEPDDPGLSSRYIHEAHQLPDYCLHPEAWTAALRALIVAGDFRLVFPCSDDNLIRLELHAESLGRGRLALPNPEAFAAFTDKAATKALAGQLGIPVADGFVVEGGITPAMTIARLGIPLVLKPRASYRAGDARTKSYARIVRNDRELNEALPEAAAGGWLAEAFFDGSGVGISVVARDGAVRLAAQHRRLQTLSETGGSSVRITETTDPDLLADVEKLAAATKLTGVAMFEFRCDRPRGRHVLLEVNARFWGSLPLAVAAGADFPACLWDELRGASNETDGAPFRSGVVRHNMSGEFDRRTTDLETSASLPARLRACLSMLLFLASLRFSSRFDSWAADDPAPFFVERRAVLERVTAAASKRLSALWRLRARARWRRSVPGATGGEAATPAAPAIPPAT